MLPQVLGQGEGSGWQQKVRGWFRKAKRSLPWRESPTPYRVWISEVMLQQTQVAFVLPYYRRWLERLPTIKALADAPLDEVIKLWEGLGYYSRARNLHAGAQQVLADYGGELPADAASLSKIKGLGSYTVGAILSFAFRQKAAAVDGNVIRVLTRFFAIGEDVSKPKVVEGLREVTLAILPDEQPWEVMEGLIELGATICRRKPDCLACPIREDCRGYEEGRPELYPYKSKKQAITLLERSVAVVEAEGHLLLRRGEEGRVMADLYEFPYLPKGEGVFEELLGLSLKRLRGLPEVRHTFTRYRARLYPEVFEGARQSVDGYEWIPLSVVGKLPFSSGHKKVLGHYTSSS